MFKNIFNSRLLLVLLPLAAWLFVFQPYLAGAPAMTRHGIDYYHLTKYFMENLTRGEYPLWYPFQGWGRPDDIDQRFIGEQNPFLWLYPFFTFLGLSRPVAYILYAFIYFQVGMLGFYLLAKRLFHDRAMALAAYVLMMFSSIVFPIFVNSCLLLIFIPVIWFFYYLLAFAQTPRRHFFLGLIFSAALISVTYMPFYFLHVFLAFAAGMLILFWRETRAFLTTTVTFLRTHPWFSLVCLIFLALALVPGVQWYLESGKGEMILSWRHENAADAHTASLSLETIKADTVAGLVSLRALLTNLDDSRDLPFYISVFFYLTLLLSVLNRMNRKLILLALMAVWSVLIALADLTPVHAFLFHHVFFYHLFRNLIYFIYFTLPIVILFAVGQLKIFLSTRAERGWRRTGRVVFILAAHAGFACLLYVQEAIFMTSYITVALSALFFLAHEYGFFQRRENLLALALLPVLLLQPLQVFAAHVHHGFDVVPWFPYKTFVPRFSYIRPPIEDVDYYKGMSDHATDDTSGAMPWKYVGLRWSYAVHTQLKPEIWEPYTRYKFVLYDHVEGMDREQPDFPRLAEAFTRKDNTAFVFRGPEEVFREGAEGAPQAEFVEGPSDRLRVEAFQLNSIRIRTEFEKKKFLVYNDSFHKNWRAFVNGVPVQVEQANVAFKGIWVPAGVAVVVFQYGRLAQYLLSYCILIAFLLAFLALLWLSVRACDGKERA